MVGSTRTSVLGTAALALLMVGVVLVPPGAEAQAAAKITIDHLFATPQPLVVGKPMFLRVDIYNSGSGPVSPDTVLIVTDSHQREYRVDLGVGNPLLPGQENERQLNVSWNGNDSSDTFPLAPGSLKLQAIVYDGVTQTEAQGKKAEATARLESHAITVAVDDHSGDAPFPPTGQWAGHLAATITNAGSDGPAATPPHNLPVHYELRAMEGGLQDWQASFDPNVPVTEKDTSLNYGESLQQFVYFTPPAAAHPGERPPVLLAARSRANDPETTVPLQALAPAVGRGGQMQLAILSTPSGPVQPGMDAVFSVKLTNGENDEDSGYLVVSAPVAGQTATISPPSAAGTQQTFAVGQSVTYQVTLHVPTDLASAAARAGVFDWPVAFHSVRGDTAEVTSFTPRLHFIVARVPQAQLQVTGTPPAQANPGDAVTYDVNFCNLGNAPTRYALVPQVTVNSQPKTWASTAVAMPASMSVDPGQCTPTGSALLPSWVLQVPYGEPVSDASISLASQDLNDAATRSGTVFRQLHVAAAALPQVSTDSDRQPVLAGQSADFTLHLRNRGNVAGTFTLSAAADTAQPAGWTLAQPADAAFTIAPGQSTDATYHVTAPGSLQADSLYVFHATLAGDSVPSSTQTFRAAPPLADLRVCLPALENAAPDLAQCRAADPNLLTSPSTLFRGFGGTLRLLVENVGVRDSESATQLKVDFADETGHKETLLADIPVLTTTGPGQRVVLALPVNTTAGKAIHVKAQSDPAAKVTQGILGNDLLETDLHVEEFGIQVVTPPERLVQPGEAVSLSGPLAFQVQNLGTRGYDLSAQASMSPAWASFSPTSFIGQGAQAGQGVPRGSTAPVTVSFTVPEHPGTESANLTLTVSHAELPTIQKQVVVRFRIEDKQAPLLGQLVADPPTVALNGSSMLALRVADATGVRSVTLTIVHPDGSKTTQAMVPHDEADLYATSVRFDRLGSYRISASAEDSSARRNVADGYGNPALVTVLSADGPHLQRVFPTADGASLRPGTPLVFSFVDVTPLRSITAVVGGHTNSLPTQNPIQVATDGLPDGPLTVALTVLDTQGRYANLTAAVVIDGTAPVIHAISLTPANPAPGALATFTAKVTDASPIRLVLLRLQAPDGRLEDWPMSYDATNQTYTVSKPYPTTVQTAQVVAEDAPGNRGFAERSLGLLSAGTTKASPLAIAPLLALGLLAVARRRRA